jgi:hypothetical protein
MRNAFVPLSTLGLSAISGVALAGGGLGVNPSLAGGPAGVNPSLADGGAGINPSLAGGRGGIGGDF